MRADLAHRLLHEDGIPADIRVAGLLVVLYGQHLSRIASIERENVDLESTPPRIKLGKNWLELPDPMGRHITELLAQGPRRNAPFTENARWLFLGYGTGAHLSSDRLGARLAEYGIHARSMRNTVLFQLGATRTRTRTATPKTSSKSSASSNALNRASSEPGWWAASAGTTWSGPGPSATA